MPNTPEPYSLPTGNELKPRPVGEESGIVVFNYNPISAVNYGVPNSKIQESSDSDISSSDSPDESKENSVFGKKDRKFTTILRKLDDHLSSNSKSSDSDDDDDDDDEDEDDEDDVGGIFKKSTGNFSRSAVGGSKYLSNCHPYNPEEYEGLEFESRFESGNLAKAVMITHSYYELHLRPDLYTSRSKQWFYFRVRKTKRNVIYRFSIVNLVKSDSLYNEGMRPLMYSTINARQLREGWKRCGDNVCYFRNDEEGSSNDDDEENSSYTLTFNIEFQNDDDTIYFAHSYPYTYTELQDYLMDIQKHPIKSKYCKLRLLCRSLAGNNVYYLTVTAPTDEEALKRKKTIVVSARVHPSETPASWMMKGLMDFVTGDTVVAKRLRHKFIFKLIPMLNPDGVIVGNTRNSLTGKDLNRQYRTVIRETYPSIWYTKAMIKRLIDECGVAMYCDMHAHSRKHNIFIYGCENRRNPEKKLTEQVFPLMMHKNVADKFSFESCKFKVQRSKEGTGRIVVWMLGITNSYTIEASFGGSALGSRKGTHFNTLDYEHIGRAFCETLLDYCDDNPIKVRRNAKYLKQVKKIRRRERHEKQALHLKKLAEQERLRLKIIERLLKEGSSAEEPLNIPLSDYSSDEGNSSSSSDNEGKASIKSSDLEGPCCAPTRAPPSSPELIREQRRFRFMRMRKVMSELDRIYFKPLIQKRLRATRRLRRMRQKRKIRPTRESGGQDNFGALDKTKNKIKSVLGKSNSKQSSQGTLQKSSQTKVEVKLKLKDMPSKLKLTEVSSKKNLKEESSSDTLKSDEEFTDMSAGARRKCIRRRKKKRKRKSSSTDPPTDPQEGTRRIKISRKLRLWLEERKIIISRQKKNRKARARLRLIRTRKKINLNTRALLDLPTTDPGSDIVFSTDDECFGEPSTQHIDKPNYYTVPPCSRRTLLQSELQRRYIEEIGDGASACMPPELIVTSPSNKTRNLPFYGSILAGPAPNRRFHTDRTASGTNAKRANSWNNLDANVKGLSKFRTQMASQKNNGSTSKVNNNNNTSSKEDLQYKLSLKKKIWTGMHVDSENNYVDRDRPLSWSAVPPITSKSSRKEKPTGSALAGKRQEGGLDLLNACSQKLLALSESNTSLARQRSIMSVNLIVPKIDEDTNTMNIIQKVEYSPIEGSVKIQGSNSKSKKRKNPKIAETTHLVTPINRTSRFPKYSNMATQAANQSFQLQPLPVGKFKTSGLVATAVQPSTKKSKELLGATSSKVARHTQVARAAAKAAVNKAKNSNTVLDVVTVTTKLKKRKSGLSISSSTVSVTAVGSRSSTMDIKKKSNK